MGLLAGILSLLLPPAAAAGDAPPPLDTRHLRLTLRDGKLTGSFEYALVVGTYYEWNTDPTAVPGLLSELTRRTGLRAKLRFSPIALDEDRLRANPLVIMTGNRFFHLTEAEQANLRRYLQAGGFIYADDCGGADRSFRNMIRQLLPKAKLAELKADHPIFSAHYRLQGVPKVLDLYAGPARGYGAYLGDRLAVFYTYDTDIPCGWEKNPDGSYVHLLTRARHEHSFRMGTNIVIYALTELYKRQLAALRSPPASGPAPPAAAGAFLGRLRRYRMQPKLPCNLIRDIAPAGRYVWFGGRRMLPGEQEGLGRYDYDTDSWRLFLDSEGVLADEINALAADDRGQLWIGTSTLRRRWNYGLWRYDPKAGRSRRYTQADGLVDFDVYDLLVAGDRLYAATRSGLAIFDRPTGRWSKDPTHHRNYVDLTLCLAFDGRHLWMGRAPGLRRLDTRTGRYHQFDARNSPIDGMVNALVADGDRLWVSNPPKLWVYRDGRFSTDPAAAQVAAAGVRDAAADEKLLCFATRRGGLHVLDRKTRRWRSFARKTSLPCDDVARVALDTKSIWVAFGEDPLGVGRYDRSTARWHFHGYRAGIPCNHIHSLTWLDGTLYVGTMANGLWAYRTDADRWVNLNLQHRAEHEPVRRCDVYALLVHAGRLWLATNRGLCEHRPNSNTYTLLHGMDAAVSALAPQGGQILCRTRQRGLMAYDPKTARWADLNRPYRLPPCALTALAVDAARVYAGTERGLAVLQESSPPFFPQGLLKQRVTSLAPVAGAVLAGTDDGVWKYLAHDRLARRVAGTAGAPATVFPRAGPRPLLIGTSPGLAILDQDGNLRAEPRLADHVVSDAALGPKHLWIATLGHGLIRAELGPAASPAAP